MLIQVVPWCDHRILPKEHEPFFYLEKDNWDDNYFKTRYHLHLSSRATTDGVPVWIGELKILKKGQGREDHAQVDVGKIDFLDAKYCSIGQSLDYYERLSRLPVALRHQIMMALRDIAVYPEIRQQFDGEEGYALSLMRYHEPDDDFFTMAPAILEGSVDTLPSPDLTVKVQTHKLLHPLTLEFDSPEHEYADHGSSPARVAVFTGEFEADQERFVADLSRILIASNDDRELLENEIGWIDPLGLAFTGMICLSYAPKQHFSVPGIYLHEKEQIARDILQGSGRFLYCGRLDLPALLDKSLSQSTIDTDGRVWEHDITSATIDLKDFFKPPERLCEEFVAALASIEDDPYRLELFAEIRQFTESVPALQYIEDVDLSGLTDRERDEFFLKLLPEQQFLFHALVHLTLWTKPRSIVLIASPEQGFPPELLEVLMKAVHHLLDRVNAIMIIATRDEGILRTTHRNHIAVFSRHGDYIKVSPPDLSEPEGTNYLPPDPGEGDNSLT
jgi:hypothetical protein